MAVVEFNGKHCTWEDLFDVADDFDRALFGALRGVGFGLTWTGFSDSLAERYGNTPFKTLKSTS